MSSLCPFANLGGMRVGHSTRKFHEDKKEDVQSQHNEDDIEKSRTDAEISPKCPFGYDSKSFKIGPFSCVICRALLYESSRCIPCSHKFCKACILRFKDCPLCGADIDKIEPENNLQVLVDQFIEGHARIKRKIPYLDGKGEDKEDDQPLTIIYEDVSLERGSFLLQQAMRAFQAQNLESAKSRLALCVKDIREQMEKYGRTAELCSQLGAVLGVLGDCCRTMEDLNSAIKHYSESVEFLSEVPLENSEAAHSLSVSLNKIGDLKYYGGDLLSAQEFYHRSLDVRKKSLNDHSKLSSQAIDVAVSLAKVADVDRNMGNELGSIKGFQEAVKCLESLSFQSNDDVSLLQKRQSVLEFLQAQLNEVKDTAPKEVAY